MGPRQARNICGQPTGLTRGVAERFAVLATHVETRRRTMASAVSAARGQTGATIETISTGLNGKLCTKLAELSGSHGGASEMSGG